MAGHHDVFDRFSQGLGPIPNWLGVRTRREFFTPDLNFVALTPPTAVDSEYLEWIDLLESVVEAGAQYSMIELGAGYGRWTVNAAAAVRAFGRSRYRLLAVEAEPTHFDWLKQHCRDNAIVEESREGSLRLLEAAVTADGLPVDFGVGNPGGWYGQAVADGTWSPESVRRVPGVRLSELVLDLGHVDLVHADVQGMEFAAVQEAADALDVTTRRLHIGTHNAAGEQGLRELLSARGWRCTRDYPANAAAETEWGPMDFQDGVQAWVNPAVGSGGMVFDEYDPARSAG